MDPEISVLHSGDGENSPMIRQLSEDEIEKNRKDDERKIEEEQQNESDDDKMCIGYSPNSMTQEEWDEKMNTITFPSLCDGAQTAAQN